MRKTENWKKNVAESTSAGAGVLAIGAISLAVGGASSGDTNLLQMATLCSFSAFSFLVANKILKISEVLESEGSYEKPKL